MTRRIDRQEVRHISHLARLKLTEAEAARFGAELSDILDYMAKLAEVNTEDVEPTAHALPVTNVFRDDVPGKPLGGDRVLANAPDKAPPYFKVPKVLDQE